MKTPDEIYGNLFVDVQSGQVFKDSKTFVDCIPKYPPEEILASYNRLKSTVNFDLSEFVYQHFDVPPETPDDPAERIPGSANLEEHIEGLWQRLRREQDEEIPGDSRIPLTHPYVVPGGRFREMYYWDSYFTMLGLAESGHVDLVQSMVDNFAHLVDTVGHIPNGTRSYFISRSQPPYFGQMVQLLASITEQEETLMHYLPQLMQEYAFWMDSKEEEPVYRRYVTMPDGEILNRHWDDLPIPRQESFIEDVELAEQSSQAGEELYRHLRAACESGWDFSCRWFRSGVDLGSIECANIVPVDLNVLLYLLEMTIVSALQYSDREDEAEAMRNFAEDRKNAILKYCWDSEKNFFYDYNFNNKSRTQLQSLAAVYPLYASIATEEQARAVAKKLEDDFLAPGGLRTTTVHSGQQWDAPNGWAPLQWVAYEGLRNYGFNNLAREIAQRWVSNCDRVFHNTGKMMEKYNVEDIGLDAGGGEYPVQDGFGWTNGVVLKFIRDLGN